MTDFGSKDYATLNCMALHDLFTLPLSIPEYQRSYSWEASTHVEVLLKDLLGCSKPYLMGTVLLHEVTGHLDIVDGQQRLVTLTILCKLLGLDIDSSIKLPILGGKFSQQAAHKIRQTKNRVEIFLTGITLDEKDKLKKLLGQSISSISPDSDTELDPKPPSLLFHVVTLRGTGALDLAYTFFDSVNSKGKPLTDFDLLKAHHLMYIPEKEESLAARHNDNWQQYDERNSELFSDLLRRIRVWSRNIGRDSREAWPDYEEFSSVVEPSLREDSEHSFNRYMQPSTFRSWRREGERIVLSKDSPMCEDTEMLLPFNITQSIEGGDAFFLYAKRYHKLYEEYFFQRESCPTCNQFLYGLTASIDNKFLRQAFKAIMLLYIDKFGQHDLEACSVCVERILSYWRWNSSSVRVEGVVNFVNSAQLVPLLLNAVNVRQALEQLYRKALATQRSPAEHLSEKKVVKNYMNKLDEFYKREASKLENRFRPLAKLGDHQIKKQD